MPEASSIAYAAQTKSCTFLLDREGFCVRIIPHPDLTRTAKGREAANTAALCVGAQYVASLDPDVKGMLSEMPRVGVSMVFARVDRRGRVSLVRTGKLTRFDNERVEDPFDDEVPSMSVETSAAALPPRRDFDDDADTIRNRPDFASSGEPRSSRKSPYAAAPVENAAATSRRSADPRDPLPRARAVRRSV